MKFLESRCFWTVLIVAALAVVPAARGLWLDLPSSGAKCVSEELHDNVVVLGDYYAFIGEDYDVNSTANPTVSVKVTSPYGNNLYHQEKVSHGQFAFTTTESGNYLACFSVDSDHGGKKGLELELKKLEDNVEAIHQNLNYLINREAEMREVSETTNARVAWYSLMSLGVCIFVSVFQLWFLRRYFQKKKLI
ncbi:hypothetical protein DH2020_033940 [Rehmannia glutinosa]|uniref:GOLD domain-containing protein n=1 Tax=Rehmannia glutinosa TaxID=99300 RepID=A0ABR0VDB4_REHGL